MKDGAGWVIIALLFSVYDQLYTKLFGEITRTGHLKGENKFIHVVDKLSQSVKIVWQLFIMAFYGRLLPASVRGKLPRWEFLTAPGLGFLTLFMISTSFSGKRMVAR